MVSAPRHAMGCSLVLGPDAGGTRRSLGPLAWATLEALVADARIVDGVVVASVSIRDLAERLGVSKNTAHRAIVTLNRAELAEQAQERTAAGRFASAAYVLTVAPSILFPADAPLPSPVAPPPLKRRPLRRPAADSARQLSLLPPA
jgi:transcriptional regulator with XRE-family HTH domain